MGIDIRTLLTVMIHPDYIYIFCVRSIERFRDVEKSILPGFGHLPCWRAFSVPFREERPQDFTARGLFLKHKLSCTLQGRLLPQLPRPQVQSPSPGGAPSLSLSGQIARCGRTEPEMVPHMGQPCYRWERGPIPPWRCSTCRRLGFSPVRPETSAGYSGGS